jgi:peptide deformylase
MAIRQILHDGDETLRKKAREVTTFDSRLHTLLDDMAETMYENNGIGLAANQIGILRRIFVMDVNEETGLLEFINPVIRDAAGSQTNCEGCLSVPGVWGDVERPETLVIDALDRSGNPFCMEASGMLAICICHENDHLDGILFKDLVKGELLRT